MIEETYTESGPAMATRASAKLARLGSIWPSAIITAAGCASAIISSIMASISALAMSASAMASSAIAFASSAMAMASAALSSAASRSASREAT